MAFSAGLAIAFAAWRTLDSHCHWVSAPWLIGNSGRTDYRETFFYGDAPRHLPCNRRE